MNVRTVRTRPVAFAMILASALALGAATTTNAGAQVYPGAGTYGYNNPYNNGYAANDRSLMGTVTSFGGFAMQLSGVNRNSGYGNNRSSDGDDNRNNNGRWNNNGRPNNNNNNNGRWNSNSGGRYGNENCSYNGNRSNDRDDTRDGDDNRNGCTANRNAGASIRLHQGTIINPTGASIQPGMRVRVTGHANGDGTFEADRIDVVNTNYNRNY